MSKHHSKAVRIAWGLAILTIAGIAGCSGSDHDILSFPPPVEEGGPSGGADPNASARTCDVTYTSRMCVTIKGEKIDVGSKEGDELCTEVPAFPLHISGGNVTLRGSEFPDITVEGH